MKMDKGWCCRVKGRKKREVHVVRLPRGRRFFPSYHHLRRLVPLMSPPPTSCATQRCVNPRATLAHEDEWCPWNIGSTPYSLAHICPL